MRPISIILLLCALFLVFAGMVFEASSQLAASTILFVIAFLLIVLGVGISALPRRY